MGDLNHKTHFIVEALRWSVREDHSYIVGLYSDLDRAITAAEEHTAYRGGKYQCLVFQCGMDSLMDTDWNTSLLHQTKISHDIDEESMQIRNMLLAMSKNSRGTK